MAFTVPIPGAIVMVVAPSTFQHSCDDPPTLIVVGLSENCRILDACPLLTVTMTGALTGNPRLSPPPGAMLPDVAPVRFHSSNEAWPGVMLVGGAETRTRRISGIVIVVPGVRGVLCRPPLSFTVRGKL